MAQPPIVEVQEGQLRGKIGTDYQGGKYFSFQGIPYAKPPVEELRFKAPEPPESWSGIRDATKEGNACYHRSVTKEYIGSEDCLFLNVYTPELPTNGGTLKAVMVWIHGGGFLSGSGDTEFYGPEFLIAEDVVIVTINYRFGLLGFLSLEDPSLEVPGNAGFKDQVLALKWVQRNIKQFCGNPSNVTVFGESSGGASVHNLMMSPMAKGLFHKAIIQSATAFNSWARGQQSTPFVAKALGLEASDEKAILNSLKKMSVEEIFETQEKIPDKLAPYMLRVIGAVIESQSSESAFLTEDPIDIIASGRFHKVPLIIGYNSREGMYFEMYKKSKTGKLPLHNNFETLLPYMLKFKKGSSISQEIAQKIKNYYYGQEAPSTENREQYYMLETDAGFLSTIQYTIKHQTKTSSTPIYFYRMSIESTLNIFKKFTKIRHSGVCHGDDLGYLFKSLYTPAILPGSVQDEGIRRFTKLWTTFAKNGDPNPIETDPLINVTWKPVQQGQLHCLDIGINLTVGVNPDVKRMLFWDEIFNLSPVIARL